MVNYNWPDTAATNHPSDPPNPSPEDMAKVMEVVFGAYRSVAASVNRPSLDSEAANVEGQSTQVDGNSSKRIEL